MTVFRAKLLLILLVLPCFSIAQIAPKEGSRLNYRLIRFIFPEQGECTVEVAKGYQNSDASFTFNFATSARGNNGMAIITVPDWGSSYTWRVVTRRSKTDSAMSSMRHFATLANSNLDTGNTRLRIAVNDNKYHDDYVFVDATASLYDLNGDPVWFVPGLESIQNGAANIRDLKLTPQGTITYMQGDQIHEIDYEGNALWNGPLKGQVSGDNNEHFHHEFTRLSNGHYMVLGSESVKWPMPLYHIDSTQPSQDGMIVNENDTFKQKMQIGTVIEYDEKGTIVWSWRSSGYFKTSDLYTHYTAAGKFPVADVHENAFCFDEKNKMLYVGFRDISRILKIKYPEGKVVAVYGNKWDDTKTEMGNDLFCGQHSIGITTEGDLYIFNNNTLEKSNLPKIELLKEPRKAGAPLVKLWEYSITRDALSSGELTRNEERAKKVERSASKMQNQTKLRMTSGGNFSIIQGGGYFVCSGSDPATLVILSGDKKIHWSAVFEKKINNIWGIYPSYRSSFVSQTQLMSLIGHERSLNIR
jgi:Arylsulfotransferase (ASST)